MPSAGEKRGEGHRTRGPGATGGRQEGADGREGGGRIEWLDREMVASCASFQQRMGHEKESGRRHLLDYPDQQQDTQHRAHEQYQQRQPQLESHQAPSHQQYESIQHSRLEMMHRVNCMQQSQQEADRQTCALNEQHPRRQMNLPGDPHQLQELFSSQLSFQEEGRRGTQREADLTGISNDTSAQ